MNNQIFRLVYISQAANYICYSDIQKIIETAQEHNEMNGLTGALIFKDQHFIQILEGEEHVVFETLGRIIQDRRGHHLRVLVESHSNQRIFDRWPLAFYDGDIDPSRTAHLLNELFMTALDQNQKEKEIILQMIECFRRSCSQFQEA